MGGSVDPQWWMSLAVVHQDGTVDPQLGNACYAPTFYSTGAGTGTVAALFDQYDDQAVRVPMHLKGEKAFVSVLLSDSGYMPSNAMVSMCRARVPADLLVEAAADAERGAPFDVQAPTAAVYAHTEGEGRRQAVRIRCERSDGHWKIMRVEVDAPAPCVRDFTQWLVVREKKSLIIPDLIRVSKDDDECA